MQIGRMHPDGSQPEQITFDEFKNWTPHPSPDGKSIVFISYEPGVTTHAANKDIALRILIPGDSKIRTLVNLVGGDGSMNVANWSPDSKSLAYVSYQMLPAEDNRINRVTERGCERTRAHLPAFSSAPLLLAPAGAAAAASRTLAARSGIAAGAWCIVTIITLAAFLPAHW